VSREWDVIWAPWTGAGLEHLALACDEEGVRADGVVIGVEGGLRFRIRYEVSCDTGWRVREVSVVLLAGDGASVRFLAHREGRWTTLDGEPVPVLEGCTDVDISVTPFTNTLPIRRLGLEPGESADLEVAYVDVPGMRVEPTRQRYTCLQSGEHGGLYRYEDEDLFHGFTADLPVDADGLVLDYPGLFRRVRPNQAPA
jgi:uncharacterized protein